MINVHDVIDMTVCVLTKLNHSSLGCSKYQQNVKICHNFRDYIAYSFKNILLFLYVSFV